MLNPNNEVAFWQPVPANGHVTIKIQPKHIGGDVASMGTQTVGVGGYVREHAHPDQDEIIFVLEGEGVAIIEDVRYDMKPGAAFFLPRNVRHSFVNRGDAELTFTWTVMPGFGLPEFFEKIGRAKLDGEPAPAPFDRPMDVEAIEKAAGFSKVKQPA